jgi:hypothetical protein
VRQDADEFTARGGTGGTLPEPEGPFIVQRVHLEIRYTATAGALADLVRLPFEAYLRGSRTVSGSGDWAPVERRLDAGLRFLIRR